MPEQKQDREAETRKEQVPNNGEKQPELDTEAERKRLERIDKLNQPGETMPVGGKKEEEEPAPDPMRVLAHRATEIAGAQGASLGSAITAPQATIIKDRLGGEPSSKFTPATLQQLQEYAQGGRGSGREGVPPEAVAKLRDFCKATGSRRIWPRKVAAMVLALEEEKTGRARPNTRPKEQPAEPKREEVKS